MSAFSDYAWVTGIFEGEGYCGILRGKPSKQNRMKNPSACPRIIIQMCDRDVIERVHKILRCGKVYGPVIRPDVKEQWYWCVTSYEKVQAIIAIMWQWLGERRREQAVKVLTEIRDRRSLRHNICPQGHQKMMIDSKGHRVCKICANDATKRYLLRKKDKGGLHWQL